MASAQLVACKAAGQAGIGVLELRHREPLYGDPAETKVLELVRPRFARRVSATLRSALTPDHMTFAAAGNADGKRVTQFGLTAQRVRVLLRDYGRPLAPREVVVLLRGQHHYASEASARGSLLRAARDGLLEGIVARQVKAAGGGLRRGQWVLVSGSDGDGCG